MSNIRGLIATAAAFAILSGCAHSPPLAVRAMKPALSEGVHTAAFRVAEARSYFAMGSIGLASEGFRRALREDPTSVDALNGLAACYDRLGRFDLSRGYYERALALAPADARLYANLATSLDMQGKPAEAAAVRAEMAALAPSRFGASSPVAPPMASSAIVGPVLVTPDVSIPIPPPVPVREAHAEPVRVTPDVSIPVREVRAEPLPAAGEAARSASVSPRLERASLAEVMLVTTSPVRSSEAPITGRVRAVAVPSLQKRMTAAPSPTIRLLNAARVARLAATTRQELRGLGWQRVAIGNAPSTSNVSTILYPSGSRREAQRLGRQLGIAVHKPSGKFHELVVLLGRDKARRRAAT